jgi:hypothetical protein
MANLINESIEKFVRENEDCNLVKQLYKANEQKDRVAFAQLLKEIRAAIRLQNEIAYYEQRIEEIKIEKKERQHLLGNALNWHKIRR